MKVRELPKVSLIVDEGLESERVVTVFVDYRLHQYRNVDNPHEYWGFDDLLADPDELVASPATRVPPEAVAEDEAERKKEDVLDEAINAFWEEVVKHYPTAKTGDLSPDSHIRMREAARGALDEWIENNVL